MLSQQNRFHGHGSLRYLYRHGLVARNRTLLLKYAPNKHRRHSRVAVIVGKKIAKSAVKRNRIRRRLFEVLRRHWDQVPPHYDLSLTVFSAEYLTMTSGEVEQNVLSVLSQARLLSKTPVDSATLERNI